ncbi:hypothetical protein IWX90DRAFT_177721 [Phyllosticta citrichinensis]|uniref:Uncharacterized protein n=1 Tax=Phyllosticta citrichinensis TaxID=1130410 RepID=A0ABR1XVS8_9PEZI
MLGGRVVCAGMLPTWATHSHRQKIHESPPRRASSRATAQAMALPASDRQHRPAIAVKPPASHPLCSQTRQTATLSRCWSSQHVPSRLRLFGSRDGPIHPSVHGRAADAVKTSLQLCAVARNTRHGVHLVNTILHGSKLSAYCLRADLSPTVDAADMRAGVDLDTRLLLALRRPMTLRTCSRRAPLTLDASVAPALSCHLPLTAEPLPSAYCPKIAHLLLCDWRRSLAPKEHVASASSVAPASIPSHSSRRLPGLLHACACLVHSS